MLTLVLLLYSFQPLANAKSFASCCVCIVQGIDRIDPQVDRECAAWLRRQERSGQCGLSATYARDDLQFLKSLPDQCARLNVWAAFHANSTMTEEPFAISQQLSSVYQTHELFYDGSSCRIFDNIESMKKQAARLAARDNHTRYEISGNQNTGVVREIPLLSGPREKQGDSSKVTVILENGVVQVSYAPCSKRTDKCVYTAATDSTTQPNSKSCMNGEELVEQECCPKRQNGADLIKGHWSHPGQTCE